jgi:nitrite reductase/ring-hydroxylating ferredoxin subunit
VVVAAVVLIVIGVLRSTPDDLSISRITFEDVPEGVTPMLLGDDSVFVVREGAIVRTLSADAQHMPGERVAWCPRNDLFVEEAHGSQFDVDGVKLGGPAQRGLDPFRTVVEDGDVVVHRDQRDEGPPLNTPSVRSPRAVTTVHCPGLVPAAIPPAG